ncbi:MAG: hypothetical protein K6A41_10950 [Bacteroidales bacterium]|nr:hypothetical protein [Bacteroidales bacterium]
MKKLIYACLALLLWVPVSLSAQQRVDVGIVTTKRISNDHLRNNNESAVVSADVKMNGNVVIAAGTPVILDIQYEKRRGMGRPAIITATAVSTTTVDGQVVALNNGVKRDEGKNRRGAAIGCGATFGVILFPVGLLFLCIKGGDAAIPSGAQWAAIGYL